MGRPHLEFIDALAVAPEPVLENPFAGTARRVLSRDPLGGDYTALIRFPPGWTGDLSGRSCPTELFVLEGTLAVGAVPAGPRVYAFLPSGSPGAALSAAGGAVALVMVEPEADTGGAIGIVDSHAMLWTSPPVDGPVPQGIVVKRLNVDGVSGDVTWIAAVVPGWREWRAEVHDTVEECLMLKGDILLGHRGVMGPGSYFWRSPNVEHGPMFSLNGGVFFFRSKGGRLSTRHVAVPDWEERVARYAATQPYFARPLT